MALWITQKNKILGVIKLGLTRLLLLGAFFYATSGLRMIGMLHVIRYLSTSISYKPSTVHSDEGIKCPQNTLNHK